MVQLLSTKNTASWPAAGVLHKQFSKCKLEYLCWLRPFHTAKNCCPTTCIRATVTPNRSLFGKPPGTSLTWVCKEKCGSVLPHYHKLWTLTILFFSVFLNVPLLCKSRISQVYYDQLLWPSLQFLWFIGFLYTFLLWFIYSKRFNTGLAFDYQPPVTL